jgi:hypothetical protein
MPTILAGSSRTSNGLACPTPGHIGSTCDEMETLRRASKGLGDTLWH